ncbi:MAG: MBL fold metallo-hydrolase [Nitrospinae bacterium]|nr:MBL fold metallo-hydrolase [Nitrospinota bacterium]
MLVKFWGVRGSIPSPGPNTMRYGGNTTCYEVINSKGEQIILDAGTGIRELSEFMMKNKKKMDSALCISHTHWDHIHGLPFFVPLYIPGNKLSIYGPVHYERKLEDILISQMDHAVFPIRLDETQATREVFELQAESFTFKSFNVSTRYMNHPVMVLAYRIECEGKVLVYSGDNEPFYDPISIGKSEDELSEDDIERREIAEEQNEDIVQFFRGADLLICDAQYTPEEYYDGKVGWGHRHFESAIDLAQKAEVKRLALTHHEPTRMDNEMDVYMERAHKYAKEVKASFELTAAIEGKEISL